MVIGVEKKQGLIEGLASLLDALTRVTHFVINLAPIGIFAIVASAAGTMNLEELGRLQVYLLTYAAAALLLTFWILPALVTSLTPITYRDVVGPTRDALITAFATGNLLIVLPILAEKSKELLRKYELDTEDSDSAVGVIVPTSFTFPTMGKLLTLSFVLFAGWYSGSSVPFMDYPIFVLSGLVSFFGEVIVAIPFLLDLLRIPADMFQLFVTVDVFSGQGQRPAGAARADRLGWGRALPRGRYRGDRRHPAERRREGGARTQRTVPAGWATGVLEVVARSARQPRWIVPVRAGIRP